MKGWAGGQAVMGKNRVWRGKQGIPSQFLGTGFRLMLKRVPSSRTVPPKSERDYSLFIALLEEQHLLQVCELLA
jgi:hypothetical protein